MSRKFNGETRPHLQSLDEETAYKPTASLLNQLPSHRRYLTSSARKQDSRRMVTGRAPGSTKSVCFDLPDSKPPPEVQPRPRTTKGAQSNFSKLVQMIR